MNSTHKKYIFLEQGAGCAAVNFLLNFGIGYALYNSIDALPLWGIQSISVDVVCTVFFVAWLTCLIITPITYKRIKDNSLPAPTWRRSSHRLLGLLPGNMLWRSLLFGVLFMILLSPIVLITLISMNLESMGFWSYTVFKGFIAAGTAVFAGPLSALSALGDSRL